MVKGWNKKLVNELFNISGGLSASRAQLSVVGYPYLHYGDIHGSSHTYIDVDTNDTIPRLNMPLNRISKDNLLQDGDVVFVDASEDYEGTSRHIVIRNKANKPFISGLHTIVAKAKTNELDNRYKEYCFQTNAVKAQFKFYAVGTKVMGVNKTTIKNLTLYFPIFLQEQRVIATALSDVDECITALEELIAKKRAVKQGVTQELLTGKRRLPGFEGEWVEKTLNYYINDFIVPMRDKPKDLSGNIPWCRIEDFNGKYLYTSKSNQGVSMETVKEMNLKIYPVNTLIVSCSAYLGRCAIIKCELITNQTFIGLVPNVNVDVEYLFYVMCREEQRLNTLSSGTTISYLSREQFEEYPILMPPTKEEQIAIACILSDMDAEIDTLTVKLEKMRYIKQGMMSELLTGSIRLIKEETENGNN